MSGFYEQRNLPGFTRSIIPELCAPTHQLDRVEHWLWKILHDSNRFVATLKQDCYAWHMKDLFLSVDSFQDEKVR